MAFFSTLWKDKMYFKVVEFLELANAAPCTPTWLHVPVDQLAYCACCARRLVALVPNPRPSHYTTAVLGQSKDKRFVENPDLQSQQGSLAERIISCLRCPCSH